VTESPTTTPPPADGTRFASHFVESVLLTWAGNLARIVIGLVALRLVTGSIPEAALGAYWVLSSLASLLANFADLGIGLGIVRHLPLAADAAAARRLMHTALALRWAVLVPLCALLFVAKPWILRLFDAAAIESMYVYVYVFVIVGSVSEIYSNFLQGQNRFRMIAALALVSSLARLLLIVWLVRGLGLGVRGLLAAEAMASVLQIVLAALWSQHGLRPRFDRGVAALQLGFGFPLYLNTLLSYTSMRIHALLIGALSGPTAVSWFTVASRVPDQLSFVLRSFILVYLPNMSRLLAASDTGPARSLLAASLRTMCFCFALLAVVLSFFRHELLALLAPPSYQVAAPAVPLLLGGLVFTSLGMILGNTFVALGDSRMPVRINFWNSLLAVALNVGFIRAWGFMGAAWAILVWNILAWAITEVVLARRIRPASRSYLWTLVLFGAVLVAGLRAPLTVRLFLIAFAVATSLATSPALRADVRRVWTTQVRRRPGRPPMVKSET
jgi:O-antigen/teichoic acid export membrane protein